MTRSLNITDIPNTGTKRSQHARLYGLRKRIHLTQSHIEEETFQLLLYGNANYFKSTIT